MAFKKIINSDNFIDHFTFRDLVSGGPDRLVGLGEINNEPSKTVPDQSLSIKELFARYIRNGTFDDDQQFPGVYTGADDLVIPVDFERMDQVEKIQLARDIKEGIQDYQKRRKPRTEPYVPIIDRPDPDSSGM